LQVVVRSAQQFELREDGLVVVVRQYQQELVELVEQCTGLTQQMVETLASAPLGYEPLCFGQHLRARVRLVNELVARDGAPRSKQKARAQIAEVSIQLHSLSRHGSCFREGVVRLAIRVTTRRIRASFADRRKIRANPSVS
jgi:hypothetical protein